MADDDEQRVVYSSSLLFGKSPIEAMEALKIRQTQMRTVNLELAKFLTDYGHLKLKYLSSVKSLIDNNESLFSNLQNSKLQNSKVDALGLTAPLWHELYKSLETEAQLGDASVRRMGAEIIAPLKTFFRNNDSNLVEMDDLCTLAGNIANAEKSGKDANILKTEWSERAPYFFEIFENYDYKRLLLLKDVFIKLETDKSNVLTTFRKDNETALEHALNFNPTDEIERFSKDAMSKTLPIENIKSVQEIKPKSSPAEFTSSAHTSPSKHNHHSLLSKRKSKIIPSSSSSAPISPAERQASISTQASSSTITSEPAKKEKSKLRSKFGSVLRGGRKSKKDKLAASAGIASIAESDNASVASSSGSKSYSAQNGSTSALSTGAGTSGSTSDAHAALTANSAKPKSINAVEETPSEVNTSTSTAPDVSHQQQTAPSSVGSNSYPSMQPTKRSDSFNHNESLPPTQTSTSAYPIPGSVPEPKNSQIPQPQQSVFAPQPPIARKHVTSIDESSSASTSSSAYPTSQMNNVSIRDSYHHGVAAPPVPAQRKSTIPQAVPERSTPAPERIASQSTIEPLSAMTTGSSYLQQQSTGAGNALQRNTTGGGSLTSGQVQHPPLTQPGLNASIVELFNATFKDGELVRSNAVGEVAFSYIISDQITKIPSRIDLKVEPTSDASKELPEFLVNPIFLQQTSPTDYTITDASQIHLRTSGGLKYMLNDPVSPIAVHPIWKHEQNQSTVIVSLKPIPQLIQYLESHPNSSITLNNLLVSVAITGASSSSAATKPAGSFNREKNRVNWNLYNTPIIFTSSNSEQRLIARFTTDGLASEAPSGVQIRFTINHEHGGDAVSSLNTSFKLTCLDDQNVDPFGSVENVEEWKDVPTLKTVVAGTYTGHA